MTDALRRATATVEYVTDDAILATTDVVFNQPTRRFYYVYDNGCDSTDGASEPAACSYDINGVDVDIEGYDVYATLDGENNRIAVGAPDFWDREEDNFVGSVGHRDLADPADRDPAVQSHRRGCGGIDQQRSGRRPAR